MDVLCGKCGQSFSVDERQAGSDAPCPHCQAAVRVPSLSSDAPSPPAGDESDEFLIKARLALKKKMLVTCPNCSLRLVVRQKLSGKVIQCPSCSHELTVPESFMPAEEEPPNFAASEAVRQRTDVHSAFRMPAIAVYRDFSPLRWLAAAAAAIFIATAAGFATGYFFAGSPGRSAPAQNGVVAPSTGTASPANATPAAP